MSNLKYASFLLLTTIAFAFSAAGQDRQVPTRTFPETVTQTSQPRKPAPKGAWYSKFGGDDGNGVVQAQYNGGPEPQMCPKDSAGKPRANAPKGCVIEWLDPTAVDPKTGKPFQQGSGDGQSIRQKQPGSNALPEKEDEVLANRPGQPIKPNARPFQTSGDDGQSIRRRQPRNQSVNIVRPPAEVAVDNPNAQPIKNATTRPKPIVKQNPNPTVGGDKPKTKAQRPPNGPVGKPKRAPISLIEREPIASPVSIKPPAGESDLSKQKKPTQDRLGNFEIQRVQQNRDMEITMAADGKAPVASKTETVNNNETATRTRRPGKRAPLGLECGPNRDLPACQEINNVAVGDVNRDAAAARTSAPTEEVRLERTARPVSAPKRKPAARRTVRKPN